MRVEQIQHPFFESYLLYCTLMQTLSKFSIVFVALVGGSCIQCRTVFVVLVDMFFMRHAHAHKAGMLYSIMSPVYDIWPCPYYMPHYISICCSAKFIFDFSYFYSHIECNMSLHYTAQRSRKAQLRALHSTVAFSPRHSK